MANFQYIATVLAFSVGKPFRKAFYTNSKFLWTLLFATSASIILVFLNSSGFLNFMDVRKMLLRERDINFSFLVG